MTWNYRVIRSTESDGTDCFAIHEVYYDDAGAVKAWTAEPCSLVGDTLTELNTARMLLFGAFKRPVLNLEDLEVDAKRRRNRLKRKGVATP